MRMGARVRSRVSVRASCKVRLEEGQRSGCRPVCQVRSSGSRGNAVREERRVHLATLPRSEGAVRLPPLLVLLRCRVRRKEDMVSTSTAARVAVEVVTVKAVEVRVAAATEEVVTAEEGSAVAARVAVERVVVEMARARLLGRRLLGAHRHSRGPHGHAGLHARRQEGAGRHRGKDNEEGAEHDRRCTGERSLQSFRVCSLGTPRDGFWGVRVWGRGYPSYVRASHPVHTDVSRWRILLPACLPCPQERFPSATGSMAPQRPDSESRVARPQPRPPPPFITPPRSRQIRPFKVLARGAPAT